MNVGLDLGTSYSLVARVQADGTPTLMPDCVQQDLFHTPSVVCFAHQAAYVGRMAELLLDEEPHLDAIRFFKRHLGSGEPVHFDHGGGGWRAEALAALVLKKLRYDAETSSASGVEGAVITVPAHFTDPQRRAVIAAAMMADLPVLGLVEEPVAAALHYGATNASEGQVLLVFDWGGGTFDVSVVASDRTGLSVLSKSGMTDLGGKELDECVAVLIMDACSAALRQKVSTSPRTLLDLRRTAEELKIELSMPTCPGVARTMLLGDLACHIQIAQSAFMASVAPLLDRCEQVVLTCLRAAHLIASDVHAVLLVGGSSMVPDARRRMEQLFPGRVRYHEPAKAIAFGAAIHAAQLSGDAQLLDLPPALRGVSGHATGVRVLQPQSGHVSVDALVPQNVPLPARAKRTYFTTRTDQARVVLDIIQFRENEPSQTYLGQLIVGPIIRPRINYPVDVTIEVRADSTVAVIAHDAETGLELEQVFTRDDEAASAVLAGQHALVRGMPVNNL
jgi:molecular chaperone DnaK